MRQHSAIEQARQNARAVRSSAEKARVKMKEREGASVLARLGKIDGKEKKEET